MHKCHALHFEQGIPNHSGGDLVSLVWMDEIRSHHAETLVETIAS